MTMDGSLECLVKLLQGFCYGFCYSPPVPENPSAIYSLFPLHPPKQIPILNAAQFDKYAAYRFSLAFLCVVNIGVRRIEQTQRRVIQAGALNVVGCILEVLLASKGFSVGPSSNVSGVPRETREQHARELAAIEKEEVVVLTKALQHAQKCRPTTS